MKHAEELLEKYNAGLATPEEKAVVESWYLKYKTPPSDLTSEDLLYEVNIGYAQLQRQLAGKKTVRWWPRVAVAASLLLCVSIGLVWFKKQAAKNNTTVAAKISHEILPGSNKAMLTLSDGRKLMLDSAENGNLAEQQGVNIIKHDDGQLAYVDHGATNKAIAMNTLETPRGGQYQVQLPDGTKVWLNSASSIKYPSRFSGDKRRVELTGEAYFEVASVHLKGRKKMPFIVTTNALGNGKGQQIEVLGTHFNIKAYNNDSEIATTLLEGSVKVTPLHQPSKAIIIKPEQQAITSLHNPLMIEKVDVEEAVAWKNGYFVFENEDIQSIMNVLSRWYNVDISYKGEVTKQKFGGAFPRSANINDLLKHMESFGNVSFKVEGRRIIVMR